MDILFTVLFSLLAGAFGASIASFMGVVVERQKTGEALMVGLIVHVGVN